MSFHVVKKLSWEGELENVPPTKVLEIQPIRIQEGRYSTVSSPTGPWCAARVSQ